MTRFVLEGGPFVARDDAIVMSDGTTTTVSLAIFGTPVAQPRMRCYIGVNGCRVVIDPAKTLKMALKREVANALTAVGVRPFPLFENDVKIKVNATFYIFNRNKDVDNLVKFLLNSLQGVIYRNDNMVYELVTKKVITTRNLEYTEFKIENMIEE